MKCDHCDTRIENGDPFSHRGWHFCCECMGALVSWFLDGGTEEDPEMFAYVLTEGDPPTITASSEATQ